MKNIKIFALLLAVATLFVACDSSKEEPKSEKNTIANEWHIESWNDQTPEFDVYIAFKEDGSFDMYQQIYTLNYVCYSGTYVAVDGQLTGTYADGKAWRSTYNYTVSADGSQLTMVSNDTTPVTSVYVSEIIPEAVKVEAAETRSVEALPFL